MDETKLTTILNEKDYAYLIYICDYYQSAFKNEVVDLDGALRSCIRRRYAEIKHQQKLAKHEARLTALASEDVLARDWLTPEEDEAWKDL